MTTAAEHPFSLFDAGRRAAARFAIQKAGVTAAGALYFLAFLISYRAFVVPNFYYFGFASRSLDVGATVLVCLYALVPALLLDTRTPRPSTYVVALMYFLIYVPALCVSVNSSTNLISPAQGVLLASALFVCFLCLTLGTRLPRVRVPRLRIVRVRGVDYALLVTVLSFLVVALSLRANFTTSGLGDFVRMYDRRDAIVALGGGAMLYLIPWLANVFLPISFSNYVDRRRALSWILLGASYFLLFILAGAKLYLVAPAFFVLGAIYCRRRENRLGTLSVLLAICLFVGPAVLLFSEPLGRLLVGLINLRTFSVQGLSPAIHYDFVQGYGLSYFTHIRPLGLLAGVMPDQPIPVRLNDIYGLGNFNTNFLFGDGFVGGAFVGMLITTALAGLFLYLLDCLTVDVSERRFVFSLSVFIPSFFNVPLMTSMLTGGGILLLVYFWSCRKDVAT